MGLGKSIDNAEGNSSGKSFRNICRNFFSIFRRTPSKTYLPILAETFIEIFWQLICHQLILGLNLAHLANLLRKYFCVKKTCCFINLLKLNLQENHAEIEILLKFEKNMAVCTKAVTFCNSHV